MIDRAAPPTYPDAAAREAGLGSIGGRIIALAVLTALAGCVAAPPPAPPAALVAPPPPVADKPPATAQYLYGSGEALALSRQAYAALVDHVRARLAAERPGAPRASVILAPGASLADPHPAPCDGTLPPAAMFDMDETSVLNIGYEYVEVHTGDGYNQPRWDRFERSGGGTVVPVPGAVDAFAALRRMGVTVVINTNRNAAAADETVRLLAAAGLGAFRHGDTLYLRGDGDGKSAKDSRRAEIARHYCVIAAAGDQLGDFTDLFAGLAPAIRRAAADAPPLAGMWGHGWFVLPNPVYGTGLQGSWDEVFPVGTRWADPGTRKP